MIGLGVGKRAETYFDSIDLQILELLTSAQYPKNSPEGYSVLEIVNILKIKHNSLKPHLDKLLKLDLIFAYKDDEEKLRLWTSIANMKYTLDNDFSSIAIDREEQEKFRMEIKNQETLISFLILVRGLKKIDTINKDINIDLRKSRSELPKKTDFKGLKGRV